MSISTGKGDQGESGLIGGARVPKDDPRLEAYGTLDELSSALGAARVQPLPAPLPSELERIATWLFALGTDLATPDAGAPGAAKPILPAEATRSIEEWLHREERALPPLKSFILPAGTTAAAQLHVARAICRRAERRAVTLLRKTGDGKAAVVFLNRLSDLLFLYARRANHEAGVAESTWQGGGPAAGEAE